MAFNITGVMQQVMQIGAMNEYMQEKKFDKGMRDVNNEYNTNMGNYNTYTSTVEASAATDDPTGQYLRFDMAENAPTDILEDSNWAKGVDADLENAKNNKELWGAKKAIQQAAFLNRKLKAEKELKERIYGGRR